MATQSLSQSGATYSAGGDLRLAAVRAIASVGSSRVVGSLMYGGARPTTPVDFRFSSVSLLRKSAAREVSRALGSHGGGTLLSLLNLRLLSLPLTEYLSSRFVRANSSRPISAGYALLIEEELPPPLDETPPVVGNFSPAAGTPITKTTAIAFDVTDESGVLRRIFVVAFFPATGISEVVHDGDGFRGFYSATSARQAIAGGFRYTVLRTGGWPTAPTIQMFATDLAGNEVGS